MSLRHLLLGSLCLWIFWLAPTAAYSQAAMRVMYFDRGSKDARHAYKFELIRRALEVTRSQFGDYQIIPFADESSAKRQALLINEDRRLNLLWASPGTAIANAEVITIPLDILHGLLGYRVCLINRDFPPPASISSLQDLNIGQGLNWSDNEIYKHNGIKVTQAPSFEALFDMLAAKRFNCLPLGADEVLFTLREKQADYPEMALEPSLLIYYDFPIYLYVSRKEPLLAKRLSLGLKQLQQSGEFDQLFYHYHSADIAALHLRERRAFCLVSPYLPREGQCSGPLKYPDIRPIHRPQDTDTRH